MNDVLQTSLESVQTEFKPDELAYLALSSKIELPIRDRLAHVLHCKLGTNYVVAREWNRCDLAILDAKTSLAIALVELKAIHTADFFNKNKFDGYIKRIERDRERAMGKAVEKATKSTEVYNILLATHPLSCIDIDSMEFSKYRRRINKTINGNCGHEAISMRATIEINNLYQSKIVTSGCYEGGKAWGVGCNVLYWLLKA